MEIMERKGGLTDNKGLGMWCCRQEIQQPSDSRLVLLVSCALSSRQMMVR